ncbi:CHAD domain-containing protein [Kutzneria viridogrisea]|uniref:CHAD domain-containing protein n=1 Tax=Kutzneria albida DSM 43870 TaxID=1449976 RepID=W5W7W3_9PSEU|nr:CHAD domain-containing protein [Kutzneria albida DSM 43870]
MPRHVRAAVHGNLLAMLHHEAGSRTGEDPEDLHQLRVAVRRLRAVLKTVPGCVPGCPELRAELGWLGGALGPVRDLDVLIDRLREEAEDFPEEERAAVEALIAGLVTDRLAARRLLVAALNSARYRALLHALAEASRSPLPADPGPDLMHLVRKPYRKLHKAVLALAEDPPDEDLHRLRIMGKRLRYAAELAAPIAGRKVKALLKATKELQEVLGEHQDACVAEQEVRRLLAAQGEVIDWDLVFAAGRLVEREHVRRTRYRALWQGTWLTVERAAQPLI